MLTNNDIFQFMLIFARLGSMLSLLPVTGDKRIPQRVRLAFALLVTLICLPLVKHLLPSYTKSATDFSYLIFEVIIGYLLSIGARIYFAAMHVVGQIVSMQSSLAAANFFDPSQGAQVSLFTNLFYMLASISIVVGDVHHLFLGAFVDSYSIMGVGELPLHEDIGNFIAKLVSNSFLLSFKIAAPFIVASLAILTGSGMIARLMPNLQVFFIITPGQILIIFCCIMVVMNIMMQKLIQNIILSLDPLNISLGIS